MLVQIITFPLIALSASFLVLRDKQNVVVLPGTFPLTHTFLSLFLIRRRDTFLERTAFVTVPLTLFSLLISYNKVTISTIAQRSLRTRFFATFIMGFRSFERSIAEFFLDSFNSCYKFHVAIQDEKNSGGGVRTYTRAATLKFMAGTITSFCYLTLQHCCGVLDISYPSL